MIPENPSRSAQKREDHARQKLALRLVELTGPELARLELSRELIEAVQFTVSRPKRGSRRREMLHVSAILRREDTEKILQSLDSAAEAPASSSEPEESAEPDFTERVLRWRDALLRDDGAVLEEILGFGASVDLSRVRQLARNARKKPSDRTLLRLAECLAEIESES